MHHHLTTACLPRVKVNPSQRRHTAIWLIAMLLSLSCTVGQTRIEASPPPPIPTGFSDDFRVFLGTGVIDFAEQPEPPFVDCVNGYCDSDYFHRVVMGRSDAEIAELEQMSKDFFLQCFGIDVDNLANSDRIAFRNFLFDPRTNYRNYVAAGKNVPADGWFIYDSGWGITVTDPNGYTLGGEFDGDHVSQNTLLFFGNYHVVETDDSGDIQNRVNFFYRSASPVVFDAQGEASFRCELSLDGLDFSTGVHGMAQGLTAIYPIGPTSIKFTSRNVLTFGPSHPFSGLGPEGISGNIPLIEE